MKNNWKENIKKYDLFWPDEHIIRFLNKSYGKTMRESIKILDFGCGSGRNTMGIALEGFDTYAVDIVKECVEMTNKKLNQFSISAYIKQNEGIKIPFQDCFFDCIICWGTLFLHDRYKVKQLLNEKNRVLKKGALLFANWRNCEDALYEKGKKIDENTFYIKEEVGNTGIKEMIYFFASKEEIIKLYRECGFEIYNIERMDYIINNMTFKNSHWHIWARKI